MQTLMIKDLSTSLELDRKAMTAVHGGVADQANGTSQSNVQNMAAAANVGNGSMTTWPQRLGMLSGKRVMYHSGIHTDAIWPPAMAA